jgi:hypothetical protein
MAQAATRRIQPGNTSHTLGTVQGNALSSTNDQLPNTLVRLRDARFGGVVDSQLTDQSGLFSFTALEPGSYIVEIIAKDHSIVAASQVVVVNAGEAASAVVKLPFRMPSQSGVLGHSTMFATAVVSAAAASSVLAIRPAGTASCDLPGGSTP